MSEYLPSFIVEPVLRQARRFSRISGGEESPSLLPAVPDLQRWNPTRFWNTSPPPSFTEEEGSESTVQSIARTIQLWANQINNLDIDPIPSPPLGPMNSAEQARSPLTQHDAPTTTEFPALEPEILHSARPVRLEEQRNNSERSLNPAIELSHRSRAIEDTARSLSDPINRVQAEHATNPSHSVSPNMDEYTRDGVVRHRDGSGTLPEDDGMGPLRQRISAVWAGPGTAAEKSKLVHALMTERYRGMQKPPAVDTFARHIIAPDRAGSPMSMLSGISQDHVYNLSEEDLKPSFAPIDEDEADPADRHHEAAKPDLGCIHYKRNVKMQCASCERWYTCRLCHDENEAHTLPRRETKHMLCMLCNTPQTVAQICRMCNTQTACYYCGVCKLWNNDPRKSIYHCDDCGICRLGEGLGKDFFHCKTCAACMSIQAESTHKCIEKSTKCDCPICGEYMFTSNKPVAFMRCGHSIHESCFAEWCNTSYKCPICSKSIANMESQFRRLDRHIEEQPMPEEYRDNRAYIFCNDCNSRSITKYHWLGLKCALCDSYNTTQLELLGPEPIPQLQQQQDRLQESLIGEAGITASQSHTPTEDLVSPAGNALASQPPAPTATARSPSSNSPWLLPHSSVRSGRSVSPIVGSYFGTSPRAQEARSSIPLENEDEPDFWGRQSPTSQDAAAASGSESESDSASDDVMDEEEHEEEEEDVMDLIGHR